jgi:formylglycine-generating enzyme required for sulfatase activity
MILVYVPQGNFLMGAIPAQDGADEFFETPQHQVFLDAYWMDQTVVTNRMYALCVNAGSCQPPQSNDSNTHSNYYNDDQFSEYPVINVDWNQADSYCKWAGRKLPSEAQWEKAARGTHGENYPWGQKLDLSTINHLSCAQDTTEVGSYPDEASPYGALDLVGNVSQWVADWFRNDYYESQKDWRNPTGPGPATAKYRALRGSAWGKPDVDTFADYRYFAEPDYFNFDTGFRCAMQAAQN